MRVVCILLLLCVVIGVFLSGVNSIRVELVRPNTPLTPIQISTPNTKIHATDHEGHKWKWQKEKGFMVRCQIYLYLTLLDSLVGVVVCPYAVYLILCISARWRGY